jgi:phage terminase Nu1 subunit (DNA packaging protein)
MEKKLQLHTQIVTTEELAAYFKKTTRTIQLWAKNESMPKEGHNEYNLPDVVQWYLKRLEEKIDEYERNDDTLYKEKREEMRLKNEARRIDLERKRNALVDINQVKLAWCDETTRFRKQADSLKSNLGVALIGIVPDEKTNEVNEIIRKEIITYLSTLGELPVDIEDPDKIFTEEEEEYDE